MSANEVSLPDFRSAGLPQGWLWTTLGDLCEPSQYGWTTKASSDGVLKFLRTTDISRGPVDWESVPYCTEPPDEPEHYLLHHGDLVISRSGSVGLSWFVTDPPESVFASYLIRFRPLDPTIGRYLAWYLKSPVYWAEIASRAVGIGLNNVNAKKLASIPVPLPPELEQIRIVEAIESAIARIGGGLGVIAAARRMTSSILTRTILARAVDSEAEPCKIGDLVARIEAGKSFRCDTRPVQAGEWGVIKVSAMSWGEFKPYENKALLPGTDPDIRYVIHPGDLLLSRANTEQLVGASVLVADCPSRLLLSDKSLRLVPTDGVDRGWLQYALSSPQVRREISAAATGTKDSMRNISQEKLLQVPLTKPSGEAQKQLARSIRRDLARVETLSSVLATASTLGEDLQRSVLHDAFAGRLSAHDSRDEPASAFLERVQDQRVGIGGPKRRKRQPLARARGKP